MPKENGREPPWKGTVMGGMLLGVLGLLFFVPLMVGDQILFPVHTDTFLPWRDEAPPERLEALDAQAVRLLTDKVFIFHPELVYSKQALSEGRMPLWDPYTLAGVPHLAQGLPALFDIVHSGYLLASVEGSYLFTAFLQTVLGAVFMLLFLRSLEIRHFSAFVGAFAFGFSGWMMVHLNYSMISGTAMWLPLLLLGVEKLMRGAKPWWIFALVIGTFQTLCAGFPQIAVMNLYLATAYALVRGFSQFKCSVRCSIIRIGKCALGIFLGILLSGIQLLPSAEISLSGEGTRSMPTVEVVRETRLEPVCLLGFFGPDLFGHPYLNNKMESTYLRARSLVEWSLLPDRPYVNYLENFAYVGVLPFVLALLVFFSRPRRGWIFFAATMGFCLLTLLGMPGFVELTSILPGLMIGDLKRFLFPMATCLCVLSAFTLDALWKPGGAPRVQIVGFSVIAVAAIIVAAAWITLAASSDEAIMETTASAIEQETGIKAQEIKNKIPEQDFLKQRDYFSGTLLRWILHLVLAAVILLLSTGWTRDWTISRPIIVAVLILDLFGMGWRFNKPVEAFTLYNAENPVVRFLQENAGPQRIIRFDSETVFPMGSSMIHHIRDAQGYTAFFSTRYSRLFDLLEPGIIDVYGLYSPEKEASLSSPLLDLMGVKYILATKPVADMKEAFRRKSVIVYENEDCMPRAYLQSRAVFVEGKDEAAMRLKAPGYDPRSAVIIEGEGTSQGESGITTASFERDEPEEIELAVEGGPGWLVLLDAFASGWTARLDGKEVPIRAANLAFRAVKIPDSGPHRVTFTYRPDSVRTGGWISLIGLLLCLALAGAAVVHGKRTKDHAA